MAASRQRPSSSAQGSLYRCKDSTGQTHYGDSKPAACEGLDTDVISDSGMVLDTIEGTATQAARERREAIENRAKQERDERRRQDQMLIDTYVSVEDIERLRDQRLELLDSQYRLTEQNMRNLRERQTRLESQVARFRPYNDKPTAPPLPDHLAEEMVNTVNGMRVYEEALSKIRSEQANINTSFGADIKRFKELRGLK
jgi:hypothetical protein